MTYHMELTDEQMRVVEKSLEMYFRLMMGQGSMFSEEMAALNADLSADNPNHDRIFNAYIQRRDHIQEIMRAVFSIAYEPTGYMDEKSDDMMIAECIWDAIRVARGESSYGQVLPIGPEPVPRIEVKEK